MGNNTSIPWTDKTFNPWWGCTRISPGCDRCYAAAFDRRIGGDHWGVGRTRRYFGDGYWEEPLRWNRTAEKSGSRPLVFCASMADVFDNEVNQYHRERLWALLRRTPNLTWQIVTKRIGNAPKMLPRDWGAGYPNVWLLSTVVNQAEADRDIPKLLAIPAPVHGLSVEPQIATVDIQRYVTGNDFWVVCGGESGGGARPFDIAWARSLRDQCASTGAAFFMKQMGNKPVGIAGITGKGDDPGEWPRYPDPEISSWVLALKFRAGRFIWPAPADGTVAISPAQLAHINAAGGVAAGASRPLPRSAAALAAAPCRALAGDRGHRARADFSPGASARRQATSDFTGGSSIGVNIADEPFGHLLYHFWLAYSGWQLRQGGSAVARASRC